MQMKNKIKIFTAAFAAAIIAGTFTGCTFNNSDSADTDAVSTTAESAETRYTHTDEATVYDIGESAQESKESSSAEVVESGSYTSMAEVSAYIHEFGHLPDNYITKSEAKKLGWKTSGDLSDVAPGMSIGGDSFGNREGLLPKEKGRKYYECDIDYTGGDRNAKRLIYSNDGLIYYTEDHYESFERIY